MVPRSLITRFLRYGFASATGTMIDLSLYAGLIAAGMVAGLAAALGYATGTVWHWLVSSRIVFADRLAKPGRNRARQQVWFAASALLGLGLTTAIVTSMTGLGFGPAPAKFAAMCAAFTTVWLVRLLFVFGEGSAGEPEEISPE